MSDQWLHDNDVVIKICGYQLLGLMLALLGEARPAILATSTFSLPPQVNRKASILDRAAALAELARFLENVEVIEPIQVEIELAAAIEEEAVRRALPMDGGESQLIAVLARRQLPLLVTGDKRAIKALYALGQPDVQGRIACLEQLVASLVRHSGLEAIRPRICSEPKLDRALSACFACSSEQADASSVEQGLISYISDLRSNSGGFLHPGSDLSAVVA